MAAAAGIAAASSLLSGISGKKGAKAAAKTQAAAYNNGIAEQARQFNETQQNIQPFVDAGNSASQQMLRLLGLGDVNTGVSVNGQPALSAADQQGGAIQNLKDSPLFSSLYGTGADTILQNAAATGGLRGGNTQNSLAQFGSGLLAQTIQTQLANLSGVASQGASAASGLGQIGANTANGISGLTTQAGNAAAGSTLGQAAITGSTVNDLSKLLQGLVSGAGSNSTSAIVGRSPTLSALAGGQFKF